MTLDELLETIETWPEERVERLWEIAHRLAEGDSDGEPEVYIGCSTLTCIHEGKLLAWYCAKDGCKL